MGDPRVHSESQSGEQKRRFVRRVLDDLRALEQMIDEGRIESDVRRIGAEQEMFLVDRHWRPSPSSERLLERIDDPHFTTELAKFNLELNLDPVPFGGDCLRRLEDQLQSLLARLRVVAREEDVHVLLAGILPTLRKADLDLENMTPRPRYHALNEAMSNLRGGAYEFHIKGLDELLVKHDSVMLEACNASFQVHFQVGPEEFAKIYNIAQVVAGPVLAAAVNSPLLFGRQLWRETRIALFQQSIDTRSSLDFLRERSPRVTFGRSWVERSVLELFHEDVARFRALVTADLDEDSMQVLRDGGIPRLSALCLFNSTVYRWNRACYGMTGGKPHLRIENRVLPSGPTVGDQIANAAFWFGLISVLASKHDDVSRLISFEDARMNFRTAARLGLGAHYVWFNAETLPATNLICDRLLPMAHEGLVASGIDPDDATHYLGIIDRRVSRGRTGAQWIVHSLAGMTATNNVAERLNAVTAAMVDRQSKPTSIVADWELARLDEGGGWSKSFAKVEQFMTTDLFTVGEEESLDLVASVMEWKRIRHIPVEDPAHRLVGLISYRSLLRLLARGVLSDGRRHIPVSEIMTRDPVTVVPDTPTLEAIQLMRDQGVSCLPVVRERRLVGIITERDLMDMAAQLLEIQLKSQA